MTVLAGEKCNYCEMKFMSRTAGCTKWDLKRNEEVLKELKVEPILD
jgi:hypothetical protein